METSTKIKIKLIIHCATRPTLIFFVIRTWRGFSKPYFRERFYDLFYSQNSNVPLGYSLSKDILEINYLINLLALIHPSRPRCLAKSILFSEWLKQNNIPFELKLRWTRNNKAHTWLVVNGVSLEPSYNLKRNGSEFKMVSSR